MPRNQIAHAASWPRPRSSSSESPRRRRATRRACRRRRSSAALALARSPDRRDPDRRPDQSLVRHDLLAARHRQAQHAARLLQLEREAPRHVGDPLACSRSASSMATAAIGGDAIPQAQITGFTLDREGVHRRPVQLRRVHARAALEGHPPEIDRRAAPTERRRRAAHHDAATEHARRVLVARQPRAGRSSWSLRTRRSCKSSRTRRGRTRAVPRRRSCSTAALRGRRWSATSSATSPVTTCSRRSADLSSQRSAAAGAGQVSGGR